MAPHSSTLAWKIPWTEEPGRLQSMGSLGVNKEGMTWFFSSCGGILELQREIQASSSVGPGKSSLPFEL